MLSTTFNDRWRIAFEGGAVAFRDSKNPYDRIGLILSGYSRYDHQYFGLLIGHTLLNADQPQKLFLSGGADYLLIVDPNVKRSSGFFSGKYFDYQYNRYLNIPVQLDYSVRPLGSKWVSLLFTGRWNFNAYHSFPMLSAGVNLSFYPFLFKQ